MLVHVDLEVLKVSRFTLSGLLSKCPSLSAWIPSASAGILASVGETRRSFDIFSTVTDLDRFSSFLLFLQDARAVYGMRRGLMMKREEEEKRNRK